MSEMLLTRTPGGTLAPIDDADAERLRKYKVGAIIRCNIAQMRNYKFHKKWFALAQFAFDIWSETVPAQEYKGCPVQPSFERFRRDLTIMAGHYTPVFAVNGEMRLEANSLSFSSMDEETFENLYNATINAILGVILAGRGITAEAMHAHVDRVMQFDS